MGNEDVNGRRLLFVDIDGVLNSMAFMRARRLAKRDDLSERERRCFENPCEPHLSALNEIERLVPGLELIVSSTWRSEMTYTGWSRFFATLGIEAPVTGKTPILQTERGGEIAAYLIEEYAHELKRTFDGKSVDPIAGFAVIDDDFDPAFEWIAEHWVLIPNEDGLTGSSVKGVVETLMKKIKWPVRPRSRHDIPLPRGVPGRSI